MRYAAALTALCLLLGIVALAEGPQPTPPALEKLPARVRISAVGDCTLGGEVKSGIDGRFDRCADDNGLDYFLSNVRDIFTADDITLANLEGPLTDAGRRARKTYVMRGRPEYAYILSGASVDVVNLANNHTRDFGEEGYADTLAALEAAGVRASGGDIACFMDVNGVRVGFVGYERWHHTAQDAIRGVEAARPQCDILIASVHWGKEYRYKPEKSQQKLGRALIDAGADLVIGHHPHVVQGVERYRDRYIVYSLGNFCFGGNTDPDDQDCYIFQQEFSLGESGAVDAGIRIIPCAVSSSASTNDYRPTPLTGDDAGRLMEKIISLSQLDGAVWLAD